MEHHNTRSPDNQPSAALEAPIPCDFRQALAGRIAWVTGASRGIGACVADTLAAAGATVVGTATTQAGADAITARLRALGDAQAMGLVLDVQQKSLLDTAYADIVAAYGKGPDILIHNAGVVRDNLLMRMNDADWDTVLQTNLTAFFHLSRLCVRGMLKSRYGRIVAIGSVIGRMGQAGQANYAASKAGLEGFSRALAQEVAPRGITVNVVAPGFIQTAMTAQLPEAVHEKIRERIPAHTLGIPQDVAAAVLYLVSDGARYVTGATLPVNGGLYCA